MLSERSAELLQRGGSCARVASPVGAEIPRVQQGISLKSLQRRNLMLRFAHAAALRLQVLVDPHITDGAEF